MLPYPDYRILTHTVRKANVSKKRIIRDALPVQNQAGGVDFKLCITTFSAYTNRLVVSEGFYKQGMPVYERRMLGKGCILGVLWTCCLNSDARGEKYESGGLVRSFLILSQVNHSDLVVALGFGRF
jgi:hypothetical protein